MSTLMEVPIARDLARMRRRFRRMLEDPFGVELAVPVMEPRGEKQWWSPIVEASETPTEFVVTAELPGISPEDVELQLGDGVLTLKGSKSDDRKVEDKARKYHLWEREYGSFERTFRFPGDVDVGKAEASHQNGVLTIRVPKLPVAAPEVRTIPITRK